MENEVTYIDLLPDFDHKITCEDCLALCEDANPMACIPSFDQEEFY